MVQKEQRTNLSFRINAKTHQSLTEIAKKNKISTPNLVELMLEMILFSYDKICAKEQLKEELNKKNSTIDAYSAQDLMRIISNVPR